MEISRAWAMPNLNTFLIPPIGGLVKKYLAASKISVDVFARNNQFATYTNDLNPATKAEHHLPAVEFLEMLRDRETEADLILFDPPYSLRQTKECYEGIGLKFTQTDSQSVWASEKNLCAILLKTGGISIHCGWHSNAFGLKRGFEIIEILLVAHGGAHNDTIVTVERKMESKQANLYD